MSGLLGNDLLLGVLWIIILRFMEGVKHEEESALTPKAVDVSAHYRLY